MSVTTDPSMTFTLLEGDKKRECLAAYFGTWLIDERWFQSTLQAYRDGLLPFVQQTDQRKADKVAALDVVQSMELEEDELEDDEIMRGPNGMAIIPIRGHLMKGRSSFGGSSTIEARRMLRAAAADTTITGVMMFVDSPGGTAAGTLELAEEVKRTAQEKPVRAHIQDFGASAAFWVASQADRLTANPTAQVGSIGSIAVVVDSFASAEQRGLVVHAISTGEFKGAGVPGTKVTDAHLEKFQQEVNDINRFFLDGVRDGRKMTEQQVRRVATGEIWIAARAQALGLIDAVETWEGAVDSFAASLIEPTSSADRRRAIEMREREHRHV